MKVGFYSVGVKPEHLQCVDIMVQSVRRAMPGVPIVEFTDASTPGFGHLHSTELVRLPDAPLALGVLQAYASAGIGDWLFLDTDVIVRRDVRHVFADQHFDLAVATREGTMKPSEVGTKFMNSMPFNKGAVFSRSPVFWVAAVSRLRAAKEQHQHWMGDQRVMNELIGEDLVKVKVLDCGYNYPPKTAPEDVSDRHILHFKGPRKVWMQRSGWL